MLEHCRLQVQRWMVIAAAVSAAAIGPAFAQGAGTWTVAEASGQAREKGQDNNWRALQRGDALAQGQLIETGSDGKLVLIHGQDLVTVAPNSAFEVPKGVNPATGPSILERLGTLMFRIEHNPARHFEVDAPHLAAVVKGTVFTVTAGPKDNSVHVAEGAVQVTSSLSHKVAVIRAGQTAIVSPSGRDLSVIGHADTSKPAQKRSENDLPNAAAEASNTSTSGLTATLGEAHVDVASVTHGLISGDNAPSGQPNSAGKSAAASTANPSPKPNIAGPGLSAAGGNLPMAGGARMSFSGGNPIAGSVALTTPAAMNSPVFAGGGSTGSGGPPALNVPGTPPAAAGGLANAANASAAANASSGHGRH